MSYVPVITTTAGASAAAAHDAQQRDEEEQRTPYTDEELMADYEFKILRSTFSVFDKPDELRRALEEEARHGWQLVEKFDGCRLRLKRPADARANDATALAGGVDPYRTNYRGGSARQVAILLAVVCGIVALLVAVIVLAID